MADQRLSELNLIRLPNKNNSLFYVVEAGQSRSVSGSGVAHMLDSGHYLNDSPYFRTLSGNFRLTGRYSMEVMFGTGFFRQIVGGNKLTNILPNDANGYSSILAGDSNVITSANSVIGGGTIQRVNGTSAGIFCGTQNIAGAAYSCVAGGAGNYAYGDSSFIGGGINCRATGQGAAVLGGDGSFAQGHFSIVGGGSACEAQGLYSAVLVGNQNVASNVGSVCVGGDSCTSAGNYSIVGCGESNQVLDDYGACLAGKNNLVSGLYSTITAGLNSSTKSDFCFIGAGSSLHSSGNGSVCVGGQSNQVSGVNAACLGGQQIRVTGTNSVCIAGFQNSGLGDSVTLAGGFQNNIGPLKSEYGSLLGGFRNRISGSYNTLCGGSSNLSTSTGGFIGGGSNHNINDNFAVICGGDTNYASGYSFCGGGKTNTVGGQYSAIVGGKNCQTRLNYGFVGGGELNVVSGLYSSISCGYGNEILANFADIGAGQNNKIISSNGSSISAGVANAITGGGHSTILGGQANAIQNTSWGTVVGGLGNIAAGNYAIAMGQSSAARGSNSLAAGYKADVRVGDNGSFVMADSVNKSKSSFDSNCMTLWFQSGLRLSGTPLVLDSNAVRKPANANDSRGFVGQAEIDEANGLWIRVDTSGPNYWKLLPFATTTSSSYDPSNLVADLVSFQNDSNFTYTPGPPEYELVAFGVGPVNAEITLPDIGTYIVNAVMHIRTYRSGGQQAYFKLYHIAEDADHSETFVGTDIVSEDTDFQLDQQVVLRAKITTTSANEKVQVHSRLHLDEGGVVNSQVIGQGSSIDYLKISTT